MKLEKIIQPIEISIKYKISLWQAIKIRIAGPKYSEFVNALIVTMKNAGNNSNEEIIHKPCGERVEDCKCKDAPVSPS
jgi:hypothetical protein